MKTAATVLAETLDDVAQVQKFKPAFFKIGPSAL